MSYFKLDDAFPRHPKVVAAGPEAAMLYVAGGCYCAHYLTDGYIPKALVPGLAILPDPAAAAAKLVAVVLWHDEGDSYRVHNWLERNPSRAWVEGEQRRKSEAGSKAARTRWDAERNAERIPDGNAMGNADSMPIPIPIPITKDIRAFDEDFEDWWKPWPRKVDKSAAKKKYEARRNQGVNHGDLCAARDNYIAKLEAEGTQTKYIKHAATFLGPDCWAEYLAPPEPAKPGRKSWEDLYEWEAQRR